MLALAVWASLAVWTWVGTRVYVGEKVVPYERRRPVPWGGIEVVLLLGMFLVGPPLIAFAGIHLFDIAVPGAEETAGESADPSLQQFPGDSGEEAAGASAEKPADGRVEKPAEKRDTAHAVERLLRQSRNLWVLALAALTAVLVAPIVEEFMFRVLFQGWLEKIENRYRRRMPGLRVLPGAMPVLLASVFFASMHIRPAEREVDVDFLVFALCCQMIASVITMASSLLVLRFGSGATLSDMGFVRARFRGDVGLGLLAFLAVTAPVYLVFFATEWVMPEGAVADPIPLILLAIVLGTLYYRTHRIVPSIVLHMAFNATAVAMLVVAAFGK